MHLSRREFLQAAGISGIGLGLLGTSGCTPIFVSPTIEPYVDSLPIPPTMAAGGDLVLAAGRHRFHRALPLADTWGYGGQAYGGPRFQAHAGEPVVVRAINRLGAHPLGANLDQTVAGTTPEDSTAPRTTIHLHGGVTPPASDGHPMDTFRPGESHEYHWLNRQEATGLWFHDHAMGITRLNVHAGLFATYDVRDQWDSGEAGNPLGLPTGEQEIPLVLQDRAFDEHGNVRFRAFTFVPEGSWEGGMFGDVAAVNGAVWPNLDVGRGLYRFRLLNASNLTTYRLFFTNGMRFWVIGNDQGLLDAPVSVDSVLVAPAERLDLLIDFSSLRVGDTVELQNDHPQPFQAAVFGTPVITKIMQFRVTGGATGRQSPPPALRGAPGLPPRLPTLAEMQGGAAPVVRNVAIMQRLALRNPPAFMTLDNVGFDHDAAVAQQGRVEQWNLLNTTPDDHPIHLHLTRFRVVSRTRFDSYNYQLQGSQPPIGTEWHPSADAYATGAPVGPAPYETGWKDTVLAPGNTITRILVHWPTEAELGFDPNAVFAAHHEEAQGYVFHCHILDHEDNEMMRGLKLEG